MKNKGIFIVIDGPSASGKDTIIRQSLKNLEKLNIKALSIEETKETNYDREKILLAKEKGDAETAKAIISERKKFYEQKVIPQLSSGAIVIANRGELTTLGYQTLKQQLSMEEIWSLHRLCAIPIPDLAVITNCSVEEAIRRESERQNKEEKDKKSMSGKFTIEREHIHANYQNVKNFLLSKKIPVIYLDTEIVSVALGSQKIIDFIRRYE